MDQQTKTKIKKLSSDIEKLLFKEIETRLLRLGITRNEFLEEAKIKHLNQEEKIEREKISAFINRLRYISPDHSIRFNQFLRESVFVWINRLIGIKCIELRGFLLDKNNEITEIITTRPEYGNLSKWLRDFRVDEPERSRDKDGGFMASFTKALDKLNSEIGFVFDPKYEPGLIFPRYKTILEVINLINNSIDVETFKNDDFLGWVYQYFDEEGKQAIYDRLGTSARNKLADYDIIPYSQLYTDHYIVEFITQNALGKWWRAHHPNSEVLKKLDYLLPSLEEMNDFEKMDLKDIKILDPACGSGHFLLYAFNLLYELYLEEGKIPKNEISRTILENNLYGVDIDRRAVQLASISLYLKAKEINPALKISKLNLYSTDIIFQNRNRFEDFKKRIKGRSEDEKLLVDSIWQGMRKISALGSLLPIEREIDYFIKSRRTGITQYIDEYDNRWENWKDAILNTFNDIINEALEKQEPNELLFARDGVRGITFLNVFRNRYDIILMNPPYINSRRMNNNYKELLKNYYGKNYYDTSACFIQRAIELLKDNGICGVVFPHALSFLNNFLTLRKFLLLNAHINSYINLGPNAFKEITGERFKAAIMIMIKGMKGKTSYVNASTIKGSRKALFELIYNKKIKLVDLTRFSFINLIPFLFDIPNNLLDLIRECRSLKEYATSKKGLSTGENDKFLRHKWEIDQNKIGNKWIPFNKGGGKVRWFGNQNTYINWENNGKEIKKFSKSVIRNESYYFKEGLSYSVFGYYFCARYLPGNYIFQDTGSLIFIEKNMFYLLGYLNSSLVEYLLNQLNPSITTTIADLYRLPFINKNDQLEESIANIAKKCINIQKYLFQFKIIDNEFVHTGIYYFIKEKKVLNLSNIIEYFYEILENKLLELMIYEAYIDEIIFDLFNLTEETRDIIIDISAKRIGEYPLMKGTLFHQIELEQDVINYINNLDEIIVENKGLNEVNALTLSGKSLEYISNNFQLNPLSIAFIRRQEKIIPSNFMKESIEDFLTEIVLKILKSDKDGIIPLSKNTSKTSLESRIINELESLIGEKSYEEFKRDMQEILRMTLSKWLDKGFFKRHIIKFERRPPIWHISSPNHSFGCYLYYLKLTKDTASQIKYNYLYNEIEYNKRLLKEVQEKSLLGNGNLDVSEKKIIERFENIIDDLKKFDKTLEKLINVDYNPNIDDGIKVNFRPWQELQLLSSKKVIKY